MLVYNIHLQRGRDAMVPARQHLKQGLGLLEEDHSVLLTARSRRVKVGVDNRQNLRQLHHMDMLLHARGGDLPPIVVRA